MQRLQRRQSRIDQQSELFMQGEPGRPRARDIGSREQNHSGAVHATDDLTQPGVHPSPRGNFLGRVHRHLLDAASGQGDGEDRLAQRPRHVPHMRIARERRIGRFVVRDQRRIHHRVVPHEAREERVGLGPVGEKSPHDVGHFGLILPCEHRALEQGVGTLDLLTRV